MSYRHDMVFWKSNPEWYYYDKNDEPHLTEKAPPEAKESFKKAMAELKRSQKTGIIYN